MKEEAHGGGKAGSDSRGSAVASEDAIFHVRDVAKVYSMGETKVHALRGVDLDLYITHNVAIAAMADRVIRISSGSGQAGRKSVSVRGIFAFAALASRKMCLADAR